MFQWNLFNLRLNLLCELCVEYEWWSCACLGNVTGRARKFRLPLLSYLAIFIIKRNTLSSDRLCLACWSSSLSHVTLRRIVVGNGKVSASALVEIKSSPEYTCSEVHQAASNATSIDHWLNFALSAAKDMKFSSPDLLGLAFSFLWYLSTVLLINNLLLACVGHKRTSGPRRAESAVVRPCHVRRKYVSLWMTVGRPCCCSHFHSFLPCWGTFLT